MSRNAHLVQMRAWDLAQSVPKLELKVRVLLGRTVELKRQLFQRKGLLTDQVAQQEADYTQTA